MSERKVKNIGASVRARLFNMAKERKQRFELVLTRYALERFLYRLSLSDEYRDRFVLKGAMLLAAQIADEHRPTRDVDMLGFGDPSSEAMKRFFETVSAIPVDDGVEFLRAETEAIREELEYGGLRLKAKAMIAGARIPLVIDVGFGDSIEPGLERVRVPGVLDLPEPELWGYALETVIAEKFQAIVTLGLTNSRVKDYYDIWVIKQHHDFSQSDRLLHAIRATFERRKTEIPSMLPDGLTQEFSRQPMRIVQWKAFLRDVAYDPGEFPVVVQEVADFLMYFAEAALAIGGQTNDAP